LRESASDRTAKYVEATLASLKRLRTKKLPAAVVQSQFDYVLEMVRGYVKDARHYAEKRKPVTSLACIAYAEGLLDALKFLELVDF
jgi:FAD synthetase